MPKKELLKRVFEDNNITSSLIHDELGKPYIENSDINISISDSGIYSMVAISDSPLGIDIEKIRYSEGIIAKHFTSDEQKLCKDDNDFTLIWTRKESYLKYLGHGLEYGLINVDTTKLEGYITKKLDGYIISLYTKDNNPKWIIYE